MSADHRSNTPVEPRDFGVTVESDGRGGTAVRIRGEVDLYTASQLRERLDEATEHGGHVVVDLESLDFIDSTGLGVLVGALKRVRERDGDIVLRNANPSTAKILEIAGLTKLFTVE